MARPTGSKNPGHAARRANLARSVLPCLFAENGARSSLQELATAAGVSVPTIKHYFGSRAGLISAALAGCEPLARARDATLATPSSHELERSLLDVADALIAAWRVHGVGRFFTMGLVMGIAEPEAGPGYLKGILEPVHQALEARLRTHASLGEADVPEGHERAAALDFLAPLILALLHQDALSGASCRPLDVPEFAGVHVARFVRAWGPRVPAAQCG